MAIMGLLCYSMALLLLTKIVTLEGKPPPKGRDHEFATTARIMHRHPTTGSHRSLHKQDIEKLGKDQTHRLRLHLENGLPPLDMEVSQGSVWGKDSMVVVRKGRRRMVAPHPMDANCIVRGRLLNEDGIVTINRCGRMSGKIQTSRHMYEIEEHEAPGEEKSLAHTTFHVTRHRHERAVMSEEHDLDTLQMVERTVIDSMGDDDTVMDSMEDDEEPHNETVRVERSVRDITIELYVAMDQNFVDHLYFELGLDTDDEIRRWMISKWDTVQTVFSDPAIVGARVTIDLKLIDIWWENPEGYPAFEVSVLDRLRWFCQNTREYNSYDIKALYTKNVEGHALGMAFVGEACNTNANCFLAKSPTQDVRVDLHEFGHSLGFKHDPDIGDCETPGGFMGWDDTYRYLPCYRRVLRRNLELHRFRCLFERNVLDDHSPNPDYQDVTTPNYYYPGSDC